MSGILNPPAQMGYICGVGARKITKGKSKQLIHFAFCNAMYGVIVVDGGAYGSDQSHFFGAKLAGDIVREQHPNWIDGGDYSHVSKRMIPSNGYNGLVADGRYIFIGSNAKTMAEAARHHSNWNNLNGYVRKLMARNEAIVKGLDLTGRPRFLSCYTLDGAEVGADTNWKTGGTGHAIRSASEMKTRVYNIGNKSTNEMICNKIIKGHAQLSEELEFDTFRYVEDAIVDHMPFKEVYGDIRRCYKDYDVIIHGCNCQNTFGTGIADIVGKISPLAVKADKQTKKGDAKKLGTYSTAVEGSVRIINAYTQVYWGRDDDVLYCDYDAIRKVLRQISKDYPNSRILMPKIGCGLANGCWITVSSIIEAELGNCDVTIIQK